MTDGHAPPSPETPSRIIELQSTSRKGDSYRTWFRGESTNFSPKYRQMYELGAIEEFVLKGWCPDEPCIDRSTRITAFGSCFAVHVSTWLTKRNYSIVNSKDSASGAYVVTMGEGMVNTFVIRQQFEWAWENKVFEQPLWHGYDASTFGYDEDVRLETKRIFDETDVFILTFGLSEVWYDKVTENVFWRTIPKDAYDPERHRFRVSSVTENRDNILAIRDLIRKHRPGAKLILTLSPIPLVATFRDVACLTANSVSKATLRVAIDEAMSTTGPEGDVFYWPSYELITDVFQLPYKSDRRHPKREVRSHIMRLFEQSWCRDHDLTELEMTESLVKANAASGLLPEEVLSIMGSRRPRRVAELIRSGPLDDDPDVDTAKKALLRKLRKLWIERRDADRSMAPPGP